jgi:drug/metabolite transporter (DMT)-like permease
VIPEYVTLAVLSMLLIGIADFIYGRAAKRKIPYATVMCSQACLFSPASGVWAYLEGHYVWTSTNFLGAATALLLLTGLWAFMKSVSLGHVSTSTPIYRMNFVVTAGLAVLLLGEPVTSQKGIGFFLAASSIFFISEFYFSHQGLLKLRASSVLLALVAMVSIGIANLIFKVGVSRGLAPTMFLHSQSIFFIVSAFVYAYIHQGGPRFSRFGWIYGLSTGSTLLTGTVSFLTALRFGEASIVTPISQLSFLVSVLLATILQREHVTKEKTLGLLLGASAVVVLAI